MSRIAFCECGFDAAPSFITPIGGWYWLQPPIFVGGAGPLPTFSQPLVFSPDDLLRLGWRIKTLTITCNVTCAPNPPIVFTNNIDIFDFLNSISVPDELGLIKSLGFTNFAVSVVDINASQLNFNINPSFSINIDSWPATTGLFPSVSILIKDGISSSTLQLGVSPGGPSGISVSSASILSLDTAPLYMDSPQTWSGTVSIEATSFWGYDGVWDVSTGAQIIIPVPQGL